MNHQDLWCDRPLGLSGFNKADRRKRLMPLTLRGKARGRRGARTSACWPRRSVLYMPYPRTIDPLVDICGQGTRADAWFSCNRRCRDESPDHGHRQGITCQGIRPPLCFAQASTQERESALRVVSGDRNPRARRGADWQSARRMPSCPTFFATTCTEVSGKCVRHGRGHKASGIGRNRPAYLSLQIIL